MLRSKNPKKLIYVFYKEESILHYRGTFGYHSGYAIESDANKGYEEMSLW